MGCIFSCQSSPESQNHSIRVVRLNGYVEIYEHPVSASQITSNDDSGQHFLCTSAQLVSNCWNQSLQLDSELKPGNIYLLLPYSILQTDVSTLDLVSIAKKLTAKAKCKGKTSRKSSSRYDSGSGCNSPRGSTYRATRTGPWKPNLDTIRERSFTRRSESELQQDLDES